MKISAILIICFLFTGISAQDGSAKALDSEIAELEWMSGCWAQHGKKKDSFISENWTKPFGMMIGTNRSVRAGMVTAFEYLRIEARADGVFYVAKPSSAAGETSFRLILLEKENVIFENKEHDFPKRIKYSRIAGDKLAARVEDDDKGLGFLLEKVRCDD